MTFRHQPRWPPRPFALRPLPSYPRNPSHPPLPSALACIHPSNFQQLNYPTRIVHPERSEGSLYFQQLTRCLKFATLSEPLCFQSLPTIKSNKSRVLITIRIARGVGVSPRAVGVKVILELRQAEKRAPISPRELTRLESTLTQKLGGSRFSLFESRFSSSVCEKVYSG